MEENVSLTEKLTQPPKRDTVVADCCSLVDDEVKSKGGISGIAIKGAYGVVKAVKPKFVSEVVDGMLDEWVEKLSPFWEEWDKAGRSRPFAEHLRSQGDRVAEKLLEVTDGRARGAKNATVKKMYEKMRPTAKKHVEEAVPRLGALVERHGA
jgi:hypothetical protein